MSKPSTRTFRLIDLFAGAGGFTQGFKEVGFEPILAVESDAAAAATYRANFGEHVLSRPIEKAIRSVHFPKRNGAEVIIGGPPCQGFSPLGRDRDEDSRAKMNVLWRHFVTAVGRVQPEVFVIENVPQFLSSAQFADFAKRMSGRLGEYRVEARVLHAADFGVPQRRRRGIIIGSRVGPIVWPIPTHGPESASGKPWMTVREAMGDLPLIPDPSDPLHAGRNPTELSLERYRLIPPGGNRFDLAERRPDLLPPCWAKKKSGTTDVFGRLWWDRPSVTIRTEFFKPEKGRYLHPEAHRPLTHREAARLQTFSDEFVFRGRPSEIARQIGNAVPPRLAAAIARAIRATLEAGRVN